MNSARKHTDGTDRFGDQSTVRLVVTEGGRAVPYDQPTKPAPVDDEEWARQLDQTLETLKREREQGGPVEDAVARVLRAVCEDAKEAQHSACPDCHEVRPQCFNRRSINYHGMPSVWCDTCHDLLVERIAREKTSEACVELLAWLVVGLGAAAVVVPWVVGVCHIAVWVWGLL